MVFNATFNNISVISWRSVLLVEETGVHGETTYLPQVTDKLYLIIEWVLSNGCSEWVSEWLLFNAKWEMCQLYYDKNKLHSMIWWWLSRYITARTSYISIIWWWLSLLCTRIKMLSWIFIVLVYWKNSQRVVMSLHSDTLL